jgi:dephospho-CoA kinase
MVVVGITGGIGSGKSTAADIIKKEGYNVVSTDDMAKELMVGNQDLKKKLVKEFGEDIYNGNGQLNRSLLASRVFGETAAHKKSLNTLNSIVHPFVIDEMIEIVKDYEEKGEDLLFIESALIYEAELEEGFDYIIVVDTPDDLAVGRASQKSGTSPEKIRHRMNEQMSRQEKSRNADFVIDNSGSINELKKAVDLILSIIKSL